MPTFSSSAPIRVWIAPQSTLRTIPNTSGTWTNTGAKWLPHDSIDMPTHTELVRPAYHTGTGAMLPGIPGHKGGASIRGSFPFFASGAAGTAPDSDLLLQALFGKAKVVVASTSVTYSPGFAVFPFCMAVYNRIVSTATNKFSWGNIPQRVTFNLGGSGLFNIGYEGISGYVLTSDNFSAEDSIAKAGLTTFPAEPSASALGNVVLPYGGGTATFGGSAVAEFISAQIECAPGSSLRTDGFTDQYAFAAYPGQRNFTLKSLKFQDSDGAALAAVKNASITKATMDVVLVQGNVAGYIITHTLKNVQFGDATMTQNGNALDCDFGDSTASASSYTASDEYTMALT